MFVYWFRGLEAAGKRDADVLQWGRTREGAETPSCRCIAHQRMRFNGAAPVKVRKPSAWAPLTPRPPCFNGAAPVKVRKPQRALLTASVLLWLQWGRTREGAETGDRRASRRRA